MKYYIAYRIDARYYVDVDADSVDDALDEAERCYCDADFGVAENIEGEVVSVEDENGNSLQ